MPRYLLVLIAAALVAACGKSSEKANESPKPAVTAPPPATAPAPTPPPAATAPAPSSDATKSDSTTPPATPPSPPPEPKKEETKK